MQLKQDKILENDYMYTYRQLVHLQTHQEFSDATKTDAINCIQPKIPLPLIAINEFVVYLSWLQVPIDVLF